jgi:hypothetical protein
LVATCIETWRAGNDTDAQNRRRYTPCQWV